MRRIGPETFLSTFGTSYLRKSFKFEIYSESLVPFLSTSFQFVLYRILEWVQDIGKTFGILVV
jgi:hypothetical protein